MNEDLRLHDPLSDPPRFVRCRCALEVVPGGGAGAPEASPYRRCPVGVVAAVDCPEYVGRACGFHEDRGASPARRVSAEEVGALAAELSRDYLTAAYARRLAALRAGRPGPSRGLEILEALPVEAAPVGSAPARPLRLVAPGPVNVPVDARRDPSAGSAT